MASPPRTRGTLSAVCQPARIALTTLRVLLRLGLHVDNVDGLPLNNGAAGRSFTHERQRVFPDRSREVDLSMMGGKAQNIAVHLEDRGVVGIA
jgi:hypothetical protein